MFNDEVMSILIRRNEINSNFEIAADEDVIPTKYDICVHQNEFCIDPIDKKFTFYLSESLNKSFDNLGGYVTFGNFNETLDLVSELGNIPIDFANIILDSEGSGSGSFISETSDLSEIFSDENLSNYEIKKFYGCLDKFTFQRNSLSDENFYLKCKNFFQILYI